MVSSTKPDWSREKVTRFWEPGRKLLKSIRSYQAYQNKKGITSKFIAKVCVIRYRFWTVITGADIPLNCNIGGGLLIPHPNGIVIHPQAKIGVNCLIHQQVTIGVKRGDEAAPTVYGHVDIGAGAKVIGGIYVYEHALIGANSVVVKNVGPSMIVAGIPAKEIGESV